MVPGRWALRRIARVTPPPHSAITSTGRRLRLILHRLREKESQVPDSLLPFSPRADAPDAVGRSPAGLDASLTRRTALAWALGAILAPVPILEGNSKITWSSRLGPNGLLHAPSVAMRRLHLVPGKQVVLCYARGAIAVYAELAFRSRIEEPLAAQDPFDPTILDRVHAVLTTAVDAVVEADGGIELPQHLLELAGLGAHGGVELAADDHRLMVRANAPGA